MIEIKDLSKAYKEKINPLNYAELIAFSKDDLDKRKMHIKLTELGIQTVLNNISVMENVLLTLGNVIGETVLRLFRIEEPIAKGVGLGTASHAIGTSKALEIGEVEGAMVSLSIVVTGILTVLLAPLFAQLW